MFTLACSQRCDLAAFYASFAEGGRPMRWVKFEARRGYAPVRWLGKQHMTQSHATQGMRECSQRRDVSRQKAAWSHCVRNAIHAAAALRTRILAGKRPHRLVVRTSRRGRDNPGSTPGVDISCVAASVRRPAAVFRVGGARPRVGNRQGPTHRCRVATRQHVHGGRALSAHHRRYVKRVAQCHA